LSPHWSRSDAQCDLWPFLSNQKKKKKDSGKLAIHPDHPRRRIEVNVCMPGGLRCVVLSSFIKIGPVALKLWVVENRPSPLLWPLAYTTACTTVQAVISLLRRKSSFIAPQFDSINDIKTLHIILYISVCFLLSTIGTFTCMVCQHHK